MRVIWTPQHNRPNYQPTITAPIALIKHDGSRRFYAFQKEKVSKEYWLPRTPDEVLESEKKQVNQQWWDCEMFQQASKQKLIHWLVVALLGLALWAAMFAFCVAARGLVR